MRRVNSGIGLFCLVAVVLANVATTWAQSEFATEVKITAKDGAADDEFGYSVAISGDTAIVGAYRDDDNGTDSGSAYVYRRDAGGPDSWGEVAKITASDGAADDQFGVSVAISGDTAIVGAGGILADFHGGSAPCVAYVFRRDEGGADQWGEVKRLSPRDGSCYFGEYVAISGDTVIVGDRWAFANGVDAGAAYVFGRNVGGPDNWGEVTMITPSDGTSWDWFGFSVSIDGDMAVVGARFDDDNGENSGSAYLYRRDEGGVDNWGEVAKITASDGEPQSYFGSPVAISGDTTFAKAEDYDDFSPFVYVYRRDEGGPDKWGEVTKILWPHGAGGLNSSVAISGDTAVLGNLFARSAHIYRRDEGGPYNWGEVSRVTASDGAGPGRFGISLAISGDTLIVAAPLDDDNGTRSGSAYVFFEGPCIDNDGDGYGSPSNVTCPKFGRDCDDNDPDVFPGLIEICGNGKDDDCDGKPDCDDADACNGLDCRDGAIDDCDLNDIDDACDLVAGDPDINDNGVLDRCEPPCADDASCGDNDLCTSYSCIDSLCFKSSYVPYGDVVSAEGACGPDGNVDLRDILAVLDAFAGYFPDGCGLVDIDLAGDQGSCIANGQIDLGDVLGILDAFQRLDNCCAAPG